MNMNAILEQGYMKLVLMLAVAAVLLGGWWFFLHGQGQHGKPKFLPFSNIKIERAMQNEPAVMQDYEDWRFVCATEQGPCRMFQRHTQGEGDNKRVVLTASVITGKGTIAEEDGPRDVPVAIMRLVVPAGAHVPGGITLKFGDEEPNVVPFKNCGDKTCIAETTISKKILDGMKSGKTMATTVQFQSQDEIKSITVPVSPKGFEQAFKVLAEQAAGKQTKE